jgi:hypothetical protein
MLIHAVQAEIDWEVLKTLELSGRPVDIAVAPNGSRIFILTDDGQLQIYNVEGKLMGQMPVGPDIDRINTMQRDDIVFLSSSKDKSVQIVMVDFIRQINVSGSPYMGAANAPVTVAVFSDFE